MSGKETTPYSRKIDGLEIKFSKYDFPKWYKLVTFSSSENLSSLIFKDLTLLTT